VQHSPDSVIIIKKALHSEIVHGLTDFVRPLFGKSHSRELVNFCIVSFIVVNILLVVYLLIFLLISFSLIHLRAARCRLTSAWRRSRKSSKSWEHQLLLALQRTWASDHLRLSVPLVTELLCCKKRLVYWGAAAIAAAIAAVAAIATANLWHTTVSIWERSGRRTTYRMFSCRFDTRLNWRPNFFFFWGVLFVAQTGNVWGCASWCLLTCLSNVLFLFS